MIQICFKIMTVSPRVGKQASKQASKLHETSSERNETAVAEVGKKGGQSHRDCTPGPAGAVREVGSYPGRGWAIKVPSCPGISLPPCELRTDLPAFPVCSPVLSPAAARSAPKKGFLICVAVGLLLPPPTSPPTCPHMWMYSPLDYVTRLHRCMR